MTSENMLADRPVMADIGSGSSEFYLSPDENDNEDTTKTIEESPDGKWSKLDLEISIQKICDFDSTHMAIDNEKGIEVAWNEMTYDRRDGAANRFDSDETLRAIYKRIRHMLDFLIHLDHPNVLKYYGHWLADSQDGIVTKLVVITELSSAGSLRKLLDTSRSARVKESTYKRWMNQIVDPFRHLHKQKISIFQGRLNTESIFIQNNGVIKLTPTLLSLKGVCELPSRSSNITDYTIKMIDVNSNSNTSLTSSTSESTITAEDNAGLSSTSLLSPNLITANSDIMLKDIWAIGRLAVEIFGPELKMPNISEYNGKSSIDMICSLISDDCSQILNDVDSYNFEQCNDEQRDFVFSCFNVDQILNSATSSISSSTLSPANASSSSTTTTTTITSSSSSSSSSSLIYIDLIWNHPLVNDIYSLRILSVYSILNHFQKSKNSSEAKNKDHKHAEDRPASALSHTTKPIKNKETSTSVSEAHPRVNSQLREGNVNSNSEPKLEHMSSRHSVNNAASFSSLARLTKTYQFMADQRRESLSFLDERCKNVPKNFYGILEDIRYGLYPRLFKINKNDESTVSRNGFSSSTYSSQHGLLRDISTNSCVDYILQQINNRRASLSCSSGMVSDRLRHHHKYSNKASLVRRNDSTSSSSCGDTSSSSGKCSRSNSPNGVYEDMETMQIEELDNVIQEEETSAMETMALDNEREQAKENKSMNEEQKPKQAEQSNEPVVPNKRNVNTEPILVERRRLVSQSCQVENNKSNPAMLVDLSIDLTFNDNLCRSLRSSFPVELIVNNMTSESCQVEQTKFEPICVDLAKELIDYGLVNKNDQSTIVDLFLSSVNDYLRRNVIEISINIS